MSRDSLDLWVRVAALTTFAWGTALVPVSRPPGRFDRETAIAVGCAAGTVLFATVARRAPRLAAIGGPIPVVIAKHAVLALWAANEELVWRRLVLGEALRGGPVAAVAASTVGFALVHRARRTTHLVTGTTFGAVYVTSGSLVAAVAAHWTYNALVAGAVERARAPTDEAPT